MSQDLFAAFGGPEKDSPLAEHSVPSSTANGPTTSDDLDDDFGDFEDASIEQAPASLPVEAQAAVNKPLPSFPPKMPFSPRPPDTQQDSRIGKHPFAGRMDFLFDTADDDYDAGEDELSDLSKNPEAAMAFSKRIIAEQEQRSQKLEQPAFLIDTTWSAGKQESTSSKDDRPAGVPQQQPKADKDPNVLFDADNVSSTDEDADFGDFEDGFNEVHRTAAVAKPSASSAGRNKIATNNTSTLRTTNQSQQSAPSIAASTAKNIPLQRQSTTTSEEAWDDFDSIDVTTKHETDKRMANANRTVESQRTAKQVPSVDETPPTNVPPPVILLSAFPTLLASAQDVLLNPLSKLGLPQRQELLAHSATHQLLRGFVVHIIALCHIIAGRKQRWKRDQFLAQGMRIGPAGGRAGMKLAGVDKSEVAKEDREVVDTLRLWQANVGKLRSALATANSAISKGNPPLPRLPDLAEQMPVKVLKVTEGGLTAPHACALCGLKREERVSKVDVDIDDSFGEWWVQGMSMHTSCRSFWIEFRGKLKSR